jgi:IS30 family transposase
MIAAAAPGRALDPLACSANTWPRTTSMLELSQQQLDTIAAELNGRPRQTLDYRTPSEALAAVLR